MSTRPEAEPTPAPAAAASASDGTITDQHIYAELMQTVRHYSTLRFSVIAVFLTVNGALAIAYSAGLAPLLPVGSAWAPVCGLLLAGLFGVFEAAVSNNLRLMWAAAARLAEARYPAAFAHRRSRYVKVTRLGLLLLFWIAGVFWLGALLRALTL